MLTRCLTLVCTLIGFAPAAGAVEVLDASVERIEDGFEVNFAVRLDGEVDRLAQVVTDYPRFVELSPTVTSSRVIRVGDEQGARIELELRPCVFLVFCKTVVKVSDVFIDDTGKRLEFVAVPELSDFHEARETVVFKQDTVSNKPRVRFRYSAFLKPKFFVPPLIGLWLIRRHILTDLRTTSERVERILQQETPVHAQ